MTDNEDVSYERTVTLTAFEAGALVTLIEDFSQEYAITPFGREVIGQLWAAYRKINEEFTKEKS